jgi:hypothetical protein
MSNKLLTFELTEGMDAIEIHADQQGLQDLIDRLLRLKNSLPGKSSEHEHLMTPNWGGTELTQDKQSVNSTLINKGTVHLWAP